MLEALSTVIVRAALIGGSLASGSLFWVRAALGQNQLAMHRSTRDGEISIGGVSEQMYGEGFIAAFHEVFGREFGPRLPEVLYEFGAKGGRWEAEKAIEKGIWVPALLRPLVGRKELADKVAASPFYGSLLKETLRIVLRMIMTEGGWGAIEEIHIAPGRLRLAVRNTPEPRRLGRTGRCSCHLFTGISAGYFEAILGQPASARETTCRSRGDPVCTFEITLQA